ncbi:hypothetical protein ACE6H2_003675 [Prunus campanulata]
MGMKNISVFFSFPFLFLLTFISFHAQTKADENRVYIVYMGSAASSSPRSKNSLRNDHAHLLKSVLRRKANAVVHTYRHGFSGFAARLSEEEARSIAHKPGVVSVFPDPLLKLHTTQSWDFLKYQTALEIDSNPNSISGAASGFSSVSANGSDTIIGILDTGIWPESESFSDKDMGPIPSRWKGTCMKSDDFSSSNCNRKLIGARYYDTSESDDTETEDGSPRDSQGHGSHVAATAAGSIVQGASYYGVAAGTAKGGSPTSRIAVYKVCSSEGCLGSAILAAFDDAIADGVDVLSLSLGSPIEYEPELSSDPIAIGAFHAVEQGITVVCSAGNDGPSRETVVNAAPWIVTVAATTIDRDFESDVVLGGNKAIKGRGINFSELQKSPVHPLIYAGSAGNGDARNCDANSMVAEKIKGKIVMCDTNDDNYSRNEQIDAVKSLGGVGIIFQEKNPGVVVYISTALPATVVSPDIAAPGVNILAAWMANDTGITLEGKESPLFNVISGTSMACPHVSGIAATVKSQNPTWSPSAIRSALITTGDGETVFTATVDAPTSLSVTVIPDKLEFSKNNQKLSYQVVFSSTTSSPKGDMFGSLTWTNGKNKVRSPFVVSI